MEMGYFMNHNYEYFITIAEAGNLTKAAQLLYTTQPALSQYLKRLEKSLGVELFDRSTSPLRLTYTGERYYQYLIQMKTLDENMRREFQDIKSEVSGRLRLGIALWRGACLLPDIFPEFHRRYPKIQMELFEGRSNQLEKALLNDNIDLAVMNLPHTLNYQKFTCEAIFDEPILVAAPTEHPYVQELLKQDRKAKRYPIASAELLVKLPLILTKPGQNLTFEVQRILAKNQIEPDILFETGNLTTAINLVARGIACTFVPGEGAGVCEHPGKVTYFMLDDSSASWDLGVVYRKNSYLPKVSQLFIATLREILGNSQCESVKEIVKMGCKSKAIML